MHAIKHVDGKISVWIENAVENCAGRAEKQRKMNENSPLFNFKYNNLFNMFYFFLCAHLYGFLFINTIFKFTSITEMHFHYKFIVIKFHTFWQVIKKEFSIKRIQIIVSRKIIWENIIQVFLSRPHEKLLFYMKFVCFQPPSHQGFNPL